jgi:hypothetical protein
MSVLVDQFQLGHGDGRYEIIIPFDAPMIRRGVTVRF